MAARKYRHIATNPDRAPSPMYNIWHGMMQRCHNATDKDYKNYGQRGIIAHPTWHDFDSFVDSIELNIGSPPAGGWTLDRINNNGNYEPGNIQWATRATQAQHRRNTKLTQTLIAIIRKQYHSGYKQALLASMYGVSQPCISRVVNKRRWK